MQRLAIAVSVSGRRYMNESCTLRMLKRRNVETANRKNSTRCLRAAVLPRRFPRARTRCRQRLFAPRQLGACPCLCAAAILCTAANCLGRLRWARVFALPLSVALLLSFNSVRNLSHTHVRAVTTAELALFCSRRSSSPCDHIHTLFLLVGPVKPHKAYPSGCYVHGRCFKVPGAATVSCIRFRCYFSTHFVEY
eukprot:6194946-Pleurochrysis_carterae.AAC.1